MNKILKSVFFLINQEDIEKLITINQEQHKLFDKLEKDLITHHQFKARMISLYDKLKIKEDLKLSYKNNVLLKYNSKQEYLNKKFEFYVEFIDLYGQF